MTSRKLLGIERTINTYVKKNNDLVTKINIDKIPFAQIKSLVSPKEDDPLLYEGYVLEEKKVEQLNSYLEKKIRPDFGLYFYVLECYGIYE